MLPLYDENYHDTTPWGCYSIIALCCLMMFLQEGMDEGQMRVFLDSFACIPSQLLGAPKGTIPEWVTLFTSAFLHGNLFHLAINMLFLWLFADNIEHAFGHLRFIVFYLLSCAITSFCWAAFNMDQTLPYVGASGAVSAAMGAYLVLYPKAQVLMFIGPSVFVPWTLEVRAWALILVYIVGSIFSLSDKSNIAHGAHVAGFLLGAVLGRFLRRNLSSYDEIWDGMTRIKRPVPRNSWERLLQKEEDERKYRGF